MASIPVQCPLSRRERVRVRAVGSHQCAESEPCAAALGAHSELRNRGGACCKTGALHAHYGECVRLKMLAARACEFKLEFLGHAGSNGSNNGGRSGGKLERSRSDSPILFKPSVRFPVQTLESEPWQQVFRHRVNRQIKDVLVGELWLPITQRIDKSLLAVTSVHVDSAGCEIVAVLILVEGLRQIPVCENTNTTIPVRCDVLRICPFPSRGSSTGTPSQNQRRACCILLGTIFWANNGSGVCR